MKKKVVVAFSGGLDTSFTVMYLAKEKGYEVYAACANTGGFSEEQLKQNEENAYKLGATKYVTIDVTKEYYEKSLKYMIFGNVLRNGTYPISVSSERIFQALAIARYANEIGADAIAHGSTGAGNDQIRLFFEMAALKREIEKEYLPCVQWSFFNGKQWEFIKPGNLLSDTTGNLLNTGMVDILLPSPISEEMLDINGDFWLSAKVSCHTQNCSSIRNVYLNPVKARLEIPEEMEALIG